MKKLLICLSFLLVQMSLSAQMRHLDYIGGGHKNLVTVTTSSASDQASGEKTIDGFPINSTDQLKDASRFLAQCTFGADMATIRMTAAMGYDAWLTEQFALPAVSYLEEMKSHTGLHSDDYFEGDPIYHNFFRTAWTTNNLSSPDLLRQRMAYNLSQIMVINNKSDLFEDYGNALGSFYDLLNGHAFNNYEQLLYDVSLSPAMGIFLSHYNNPKANPALNIHPDENYAREIMQLFSIGLWELNPNGTRKYDQNGAFIPTYSNADIKEFAQVFTGLGTGEPNGTFGADVEEADDAFAAFANPMNMYEDQHDTSEKQLLNGVVLPANQTGLQDITQTINHLSTHSNTAPFISKSLIKMFTTSNPSPGYVLDVATAFNPSENNNFEDVLRAILLHPDARNCNISEGYTFGKLREPLVRTMNYLKAFQLSPNAGQDYMYLMFCYQTVTGQAPLAAPSVFNFYLPDYQPQGPIGQQYYVAPEFQILNSTNAIGFINDINLKTADEELVLGEFCNGGDIDVAETADIAMLDTSEAQALLSSPAELVDYLDILLANGLLTDHTKNTIINAITPLDDEERLKLSLYLILISPDYAILK